MKLNSSFYLPFYYGIIQISEQEIISQKLTKEQAKQRAEEKLSKYITNLQQKGVQIRENNVTIEVTGKECQTTGRFVLIEKLGVRSPVEKIEIKEQESEVNNGENN